MPIDEFAIRELLTRVEDDQLSAMRYAALELQDDIATTEEERNTAFREVLLLELLSTNGSL